MPDAAVTFQSSKPAYKPAPNQSTKPKNKAGATTSERAALPAITQLLAEFVVDSKWSDVPDPVRHDTRRSFVNIVGATIGGAADESIALSLKALDPFMGPRVATVIGRSETVDLPTAAYLNAISGNVLDFDDTHMPTLMHPGAPVLAPLLAWSQQTRVSGEELLHAFALGMEVACRLGVALYPQHYERGWHITATCSVIGAAAAVGKLIGLDVEQMRNALGIAATQASGLVQNLSSMAKSVGVGNAARNGFMAAMYAQRDIDAAVDSLEGKHGFLQVTCDDPDMKVAIEGLGERWEVLNKCSKPYPCCALIFPVLDATLELRLRETTHEPLHIDRIASVTVRGNPLMLVRADRPAPATGREAKLSVGHSVAVGLINGSAGVLDYLDSAVSDPLVAKLASKVRATADPSMAADAAQVTVAFTDGRLVATRVDQCRGSPARPMTDQEVTDKTVALIAWAAPQMKAERLVQSLWTVDSIDDVGRLVTSMASTGTQAP